MKMRRILAFSRRNLTEMVRSPLSYVFCAGFPVAMLLLMSAIDSMIPAEAEMTLFRIENLTPGIAMFGLSFVMLFASLSVSSDRTGRFLTRLYASPMTGGEFVAGYMLPLFLVAAGVLLITYLSGGVIAAVKGTPLPLGGCLLSALSLLPCALFFIGVGIVFGSLFGDKAAPPLSSIIISLSGVLGGVWFDTSIIPAKNPLGVLCRVLPFSHATAFARTSVGGGVSMADMWVVVAWTAGASLTAGAAFSWQKRREEK